MPKWVWIQELVELPGTIPSGIEAIGANIAFRQSEWGGWDAGMARGLRIQIQGGWDRGMSGGNGGETIYRSDEDRRRSLESIAEVPGRFGTEIHAFGLMDSHCHVLMRYW